MSLNRLNEEIKESHACDQFIRNGMMLAKQVERDSNLRNQWIKNYFSEEKKGAHLVYRKNQVIENINWMQLVKMEDHSVYLLLSIKNEGEHFIQHLLQNMKNMRAENELCYYEMIKDPKHLSECLSMLQKMDSSISIIEKDILCEYSPLYDPIKNETYNLSSVTTPSVHQALSGLLFFNKKPSGQNLHHSMHVKSSDSSRDYFRTSPQIDREYEETMDEHPPGQVNKTRTYNSYGLIYTTKPLPKYDELSKISGSPSSSDDETLGEKEVSKARRYGA